MSRFIPFSQKRRIVNESGYSNNPEEVETNAVNTIKLKSFENVKEKWRELGSYFRRYPDHFLDFIKEPNSTFNLYFYQRVYLRILLRYQRVMIVATRGTTKSYLADMAAFLKCIFFPNNKGFICAKGKEQAAKITQERLEEIFTHFPLLRNEVKEYTKQKDYSRIVLYNGSSFDVVQMTDASRGGRRFFGIGEEITDPKFDGDILNAVIIPLMANNRKAANGEYDPDEIHKCESYVCTAGIQQSFAYELANEIFREMQNGNSSFYIGNSYQLPCLYGHLDIDFVESKKMSPTYSMEAYLREYESVWTGASNGALVSDHKLRCCRTLGVAEWGHCGEETCEYVLSYDVARHSGRLNALSCLCVIKITPRNEGTYLKELVNIFSMEGQHDLIQARFLKQKVREFKPKVLIVDCQGIGSGVVDQLVLDLDDGMPPFGVINNDSYDKYKGENSIPLVFAMNSTKVETKNTKMIQHIMKVLNALDISLLKSPQEGIKDYKKKHGLTQKEVSEQAELEIPYILTDNLCDEIMNLEYKSQGIEGKIEQISNRIPKDKFSALMYGLWWVYLDERKLLERRNSLKIDTKKVFGKYRKVNAYGR